ncbi:hypothetical protein BN59_02162 [Legionella massiliensis]|uniref:Uncharacterized protein n=1 Tax=Legionella massiliensis TaxID=1034943 RepID=A0A078L1H1_9GAMM|nr:DUF5630 domain-containing protein [Legionella massiliensis]CDZ77869.1 hypothetical protein BN59_02162 [Legionella massiliensis]CEE13607.1 hypothetical protein BN1094_02162 [Legionella massiliensis]
MPKTSHSLPNASMLTIDELNFIGNLKMECEEYLENINKMEIKKASYNDYYRLPNKGNLYSILDARNQDLQRELAIEKNKLLNVFERTDLGLLIRAAITDPELDKLCQNPLLTSLWDERWRKSGRNPKEAAEVNHLAVQEYRPQSTLTSFDLLKGIYFYSKSKAMAAHAAYKEESCEFMILAADLGHFAALRTLVIYYMKQPNGLEKAQDYAKAAADLYRTPGYLLLFVFYYELQQYQNALKMLMVAEKLHPYSADMINNAYQGTGLEVILAPLMKQLNVSSLDGAKLKLVKLADLPLHYVTDKIYTEVSQYVDDLLNQSIPTNPAATSDTDESEKQEVLAV